MKKQKDRKLKDELLSSAGAQYASGDQWRNNSKKNEDTMTKEKKTKTKTKTHIPSCGCDW